MIKSTAHQAAMEISRFEKRSRISQLSWLKRKVFGGYDSGAADERYIRKQIIDYILGTGKESLTATLWDAVYILNGNGQTTRYLYFNEHTQRLYLQKRFFEWAKLVCAQAEEELKKLKG